MIEYLRTENQVSEEKLGKKRILLSDDQRRRLAVKGKISGASDLARSAHFSRPIPFCAGTGNWSPESGTTHRIARKGQGGHL